MKFSAEGAMRCPDGYSLAALQNAMRARELLCGRALMFDENKALRLNLGAALGIMTYVFRVFSPYECAACCALLIVSSIPEWLDLISHRTERIRFMREEEQRLANSTKPE